MTEGVFGMGQEKPVVEKDAVEAVEDIARAKQSIEAALAQKIVGQRDAVDALLTCLIAKGHCLLLGVPGLAKTLLVSTLASLTDLTFSRIQFTPDLMPSDITGTEILEEDRTTGRRSFRFVKGPIFANLVLADEINRTPPKTQAALLQAMQEGRVTAGGTTHELPSPFFVFATQNPIEQEGTYPLPEAQLDRFMFLVGMSYPTEEEERTIVQMTTNSSTSEIPCVLSPQRLQELQRIALSVPASDSIISAAVALTRRTRPSDSSAPEFIRKSVVWGAGPRAGQFLILGAKAHALLHGRFACTIEDVRAVAMPVLRHRIVPNFHAEAEGIDSVSLVERLLNES